MGKWEASQNMLERTYGFGLVLGDFEVGSHMWDIALDWPLLGSRSG